MTREMGKPLAETRGDVQEGIDTAYYAATEGRRLFGHTVPSELRNKWAMSFRRPIGVAGIITPFNFPMAIPDLEDVSRRCSAETPCVFKPAEDVPHTGHVLVEILLEAGLPPEVHPAGARHRRAVGRGDRRPSATSRSSRSPAPRRRARKRGRDVRPHAQAAVARDGRQERADRARRRRPRSGARRRALGRVRHDRAALHGDEPADRAGRGPRRVPETPRGPRAAS